MDLRICDVYMFCLMVLTTWTGILSAKASAPSWKPKSRPANHDSIISKTEGNTIKLTCGTNGNPPPSIIWYKDGRLFDHKKRSKTKLHRYSLIMKDVTVKDKGDYQCIVTNVHGSLNFTFIVEVIKLTWPLELEEPQNITVNEGEDAIFTCRPLNDPTATVKWVKRNQTGLQTSIGKTSNFLETGTKEMLVVRNVTMQNAGQYHCLVGNYFGIRQVKAWLNVIPRPTTTTTTTTTTTPTTTTTTPTTTTTTPTTTTTTPTTTTTTPTTTTTTPTTTTTFWPESTPFDWNDEFDSGKKHKKDKKKKKKNKKKKNKNKKKKNKNKKNRNKNREHTKIEPDYGQIDEGFGIINTNPPDDQWFGRKGRIRPDDTSVVVDNNGLFPYNEGTDIKTIDNNEIDNIDNSGIEFNNGMPGKKDDQQQETSEKDIDVWTIYIIVGSVAGGVLLIGVVAIIVALCCNRYEDEGYKHTNV